MDYSLLEYNIQNGPYIFKRTNNIYIHIYIHIYIYTYIAHLKYFGYVYFLWEVVCPGQCEVRNDLVILNGFY